MNVFQTLNNAMAAGTVAALIAGGAKPQIPLRERAASFWLFLLFLVLFRLKMYFDDHKYFQTTPTNNVHFKIGFLVGAVAWVLWSLAAYSIGTLQDAYFLAGVAACISTLWIVVVAVRSGAYREQYVWIGTNAIYVILLWALYRRNGPEGDLVTWLLLGGLLGALAFDWVASGSLPELET